MTREALNVLALTSATPIRDLLMPPAYALVLAPADLGALRSEPTPSVQAVKPTATIR